MKGNRQRFIGCFACAVLLLAAIAGTGTVQTTAAAKKAAVSVQLRAGGKQVTGKTYQMQAGKSETLKVTASKKISSVKYASNKPEIASVSQKGVVRAKKTGTARITAAVKTKQGSKKAWVKIKVNSANTETKGSDTMKVTVGDTVFTATLADNSSVTALKELLAEGPLTIRMSDYGDMEKVGSIGKSLPRNDEQITTGPGDIILYQGNSLVIYYDTNSWNFTRIGKINGVTRAKLLAAFGKGNVTVTFSLE